MHEVECDTPSIRQVDPDALLHPVGPRPPSVYWVRRLGLLLLLLVVVIGLAKACSGGGGDPGTDRLATGPHPTGTPTTAVTTPARPPRCDRSSLAVTAASDADSYPAGALPQLTVEVRNTSTEPCRLAVQQDARTWTVVSGPDRVWSTADCPHPGKPAFHRLGHGKAITYRVTWDRHRSVEGCASPGAEAQPGTYLLRVTVDRVRGKPVVFHLEG